MAAFIIGTSATGLRSNKSSSVINESSQTCLAYFHESRSSSRAFEQILSRSFLGSRSWAVTNGKSSGSCLPAFDIIRSQIDGVTGTPPPPNPDALRKDAKQYLIDLVSTIKDRGLGASPEDRLIVEEAVAELQSYNPYPFPTDNMGLLNGKWRLLWTSDRRILATLRAAKNLKVTGFEIEDIIIKIDGDRLTGDGIALLKLLDGRVKATARVAVKYTKDTGKRLSETYDKAVIEDVAVIEGFEDLVPATFPLASMLTQALRTLESNVFQPDRKLEVPLSNRYARKLLLSYLDQDLLIARSSTGSVDVLQRVPEMMKYQPEDQVVTVVADSTFTPEEVDYIS
mmetsp:Transcript_26726/g.43675  ORF Transcript_26726/g.43675 Transcript_26726/m.43675 type:complete len:341 (+) Transcript_26726:124-1146(+)|eukprot:CAMPEP_0184657606 /NCGR_PEP_ID=MMETSP0308-20130426/20576_1 /TAXON_ID=38269 /ORGANISM="Gloeochaete witrockiana, Strain SAG 46.84" /LENGTH=340 /DNA_ID=CAMNT_0027095631 /DNA_START=59 /DNA_END=1081 /DNA_ORIENTATION=-